MRQLRYLVSDANVAGMLAAIDVHAFPLRATELFAFDFRPAALAAVPAALQQSKLYSPADELVRLKLDDSSQWVVRTWNGDFGISPTYVHPSEGGWWGEGEKAGHLHHKPPIPSPPLFSSPLPALFLKPLTRPFPETPNPTLFSTPLTRAHASYDREMIVPAAVTESTLREAAALRVGGRVPVLCWRSQQTGSLLLRAADLLRTPLAEGEPPRTAGATAAYMGILFQVCRGSAVVGFGRTETRWRD